MTLAEGLQLAAAVVGIVVTVVMGVETRLIRKLQRSGARSAESAIELGRMRPLSQWRLRRLVGAGVVVQAPSNRVYLDEAARSALQSSRTRLAIGLVGAALVGVVALYLMVG